MPQPNIYMPASDPTDYFNKWYGVGAGVGQVVKNQIDAEAEKNRQAQVSGIVQKINDGTVEDGDLAHLATITPPEQYKAISSVYDARQKQIAEQKHQEMVHGLVTKVSDKDATAEDWANLGTIIPADQYKAITDEFKNLDEKAQKAALLQSGQVFAALNSGNTQLAKDLLATQAEARKNSGDVQGAGYLETLSQTIDHDPNAAKLMIGQTMPMIPGGKDAMQSILDQHQDTRTEGEESLKLRGMELDNLIKEKQLLLDNLKLGRGHELTPATETKMNDFVTASLQSKHLANQYDALAGQIEGKIKNGGTVAQIGEAVKKLWGSGDNITQLRQEYLRLRSSAVMKNLPPGSASDADMKIALQAFPDENANPQMIASFMRGIAKLQRIDAATQDAQAEWINQNGNMGSAHGDFTIDGIAVKPGTKLSEFVNKYIMNTQAYWPDFKGTSGGTGNKTEGVDY